MKSRSAHTPLLQEELARCIPLSEIPQIPPPLIHEADGYVTPECARQLSLFHPEVVLYCPQIPQNTGSIGRLCAALSAHLHLIEPMPFSITEKAVRRAGLDYWEHVKLAVHKDWKTFEQLRPKRRFIFIETGGTKNPHDFEFAPGDILVFGAETTGIPPALMQEHIQNGTGEMLTLPMYNRGVRSINLANTVSIVLSAAIAQLHTPKGVRDRDFEI